MAGSRYAVVSRADLDYARQIGSTWAVDSGFSMYVRTHARTLKLVYYLVVSPAVTFHSFLRNVSRRLGSPRSCSCRFTKPLKYDGHLSRYPIAGSYSPLTALRPIHTLNVEFALNPPLGPSSEQPCDFG
ncbi:hypothetical protein LZ31DRAFT_560799 [Colletotrichum somersetense]|nr:hypothetical protein LZ31DRAFT_560799 [Colletotrichum somersetense]